MRELSIKRRAETIEYLRSMLGQMRTMAQAERCDMLAYLIEMAYLEASDIMRGDRPAAGLRDQELVRQEKRNGAA
jgi:hypothetical protein